VVVLRGKHFGKERGDNWVEIAGDHITESSYLSWSDDKIMLRLPETVTDGLVYVVARRRKSNAQIFANRSNIPVTPRVNSDLGSPTVDGIGTESVEIGKELVITGSNFGIARNQSTVWFTWLSDTTPSDIAMPVTSDAASSENRIACSEHDFDYEYWSDQEIRVRVPDGAVTGAVYVETEQGKSNAVPVKVVNQPGTRRYYDRRKWVLSLEVDISGVNAADGNILYLRVPMPETTASQRNVQITASSPKAAIDNYHGSILHQLENLKNGQDAKVTHSFMLTGYATECKVNPALVKPYVDVKSPLYVLYTASDRAVPSSNPAFALKASEIVGKETNPWKKAKLAYAWVVDNVRYEENRNPDRPATDALAERTGDAYDMAILFCALARAQGIPAQPVAGILVDEKRATRLHWWAEFYVEKFGWIPVDPGLGAGIPTQTRPVDGKDWYFGNLDGNHIAFSRGWTDQKPMTGKSRIVYRPRAFAFQPVWEESGGNIKGYTSFWSVPQVTGVY